MTARKDPSKTIGHPTRYTEKIASEVCDRLAKGESLRAICRDDHMPDESAVRHWALDNKEGFHARYMRAREIQAYAVADELLEIADDGHNDWMEINRRGNVGYEVNGECVQRSRLRIDTRKWHLSKMLPKVYGERPAPDTQDDEDGRSIKIIGGLPDE
jgi:hypothetical protein